MRRPTLVLVLLGFFLLSQTAYTVNETEQVVVTQFGRPVGDPIVDAGLKFKIPFIQKANRFERRVLEWDGKPERVPTLDKTLLFVDTTARWRIVDARLFLETMGTERRAQSRLDDVLDSEVRTVLTSFGLIEAVRTRDRFDEVADIGLSEDVVIAPEFLQPLEAGRDELIRLILERARPTVAQYGIELVDIRIKEINYQPEVQEKVFDRMVSERLRIAERYRSEGQGEAAKILGDQQRDLLTIQSEAYSRAEQIRGVGDAEATRIYAEAYSASPEFYRFWRLIQIYETMRGDNLTLLLTTDGAFYNLLTQGTATPRTAP